MDRDKLVLAVMSAGGEGAQYPPAQLQKLFFLVDKEIPDEIGGPAFSFQPYDFGPFDASVYHRVEALQQSGLTLVEQGERYRKYRLTDTGFREGSAVLEAMTPRARGFIERAAKWVRSLSFEQLVSAIYQQYPEMKANSMFRGA